MGLRHAQPKTNPRDDRTPIRPHNTHQFDIDS